MIRVGQWVLLQKEIASTCLWPYRPCTGAPERGLPNGLSHKPTAEVHVPHRHSKMRSAIGTLGGRSRSLPSQPHSAGPLKAYRVSPSGLPPPFRAALSVTPVRQLKGLPRHAAND